jgi:hypothetical protein
VPGSGTSLDMKVRRVDGDEIFVGHASPRG